MQNQGSQHQGSCSLDIVLIDGFPDPQAASLGFSGGSNCTEICLQYRRPGFHPWVRRTPWRRKGQPTPGLWLGEFHGQRSLVGYSPCGQEEWDVTAPPSGGLITFRGHTSSFLPAVVAGGHPCLSSSVSFEGRHLLSLDLLQVLQGLLVFILDLSSPGKHSLHPSKKSRTAEPPEDLL